MGAGCRAPCTGDPSVFQAEDFPSLCVSGASPAGSRSVEVPFSQSGTNLSALPIRPADLGAPDSCLRLIVAVEVHPVPDASVVAMDDDVEVVSVLPVDGSVLPRAEIRHLPCWCPRGRRRSRCLCCGGAFCGSWCSASRGRQCVPLLLATSMLQGNSLVARVSLVNG